jgi:hypothetical protein
MPQPMTTARALDGIAVTVVIYQSPTSGGGLPV